ncbi:MAG: hypothetical protein GY715_18850 [Planctomycetes bacterium]|nr:hypothetical protein [Planctomycetota bacterium]
MTTEEESLKPMLTADEMDAAWGEIGLVAEGHEQVNRPRPAPEGRRWSDMGTAIKLASGYVEATVVSTDVEDDGRRLRSNLMTVEGWPGVIVVTRVEGPEIYTAEASIGRYPDEPARRRRADALVAALDRALVALGRRPRFEH